jgi:TIR domain-containing protein
MASGRKIFINYRRDDTRADAGRLYDRLQARYQDRVFRDVGSLEPGVEWHVAIERVLGASDACIVVIGPRWLSIADANGKRRLEDPRDTVRQEVATALANGMRVFPVLVGGAKMPAEEELPEDMQSLARRHALEITEQDFDEDVEKLARALDRALGWAPPKPKSEQKSHIGAIAAAVAAAVIAAIAISTYFATRNSSTPVFTPPQEGPAGGQTSQTNGPTNGPPNASTYRPPPSGSGGQKPVIQDPPPPPPKRDVQIVGAWRAVVNSEGQQINEYVEVYPDSSFRVTLDNNVVAAVGTWRRDGTDGFEVVRAVNFLVNNTRFACQYQTEGDTLLRGSCVDQLQNRWSVTLTNPRALPEVATELPQVDFSGATMAERAAFIQLISAVPCTCGCRLDMHTCLLKDRTCPLSPGQARTLWATFLRNVRA